MNALFLVLMLSQVILSFVPICCECVLCSFIQKFKASMWENLSYQIGASPFGLEFSKKDLESRVV
ncbi:uncharacterized protein DS421_4g131170 [Arachis hypogaea]|nr:uncharacterized protein DS421_4g131170 [Arachis hypogaea]